MLTKLYVNPTSPFCRAAAIYLVEKAVPHESVELTRGADRARLAAVSPRGEVPVLDTGRGVVAGSQAICDLLDLERPEPSLLPRDPFERAAHRQLEDVACSTTDAFQFLVHLAGTRRPDLAAATRDLPARLDAAVQQHFVFLDATLAAPPFAGAAFSRADVFLFCMLSSLVFMGKTIPPALTSLDAWYRRVGARPSVAHDMQRAARSARAQAGSDDPWFRADRIHWRSHRVEWACRLGLAAWLGAEIEQGRAFFSPPPGGASDGAAGAQAAGAIHHVDLTVSDLARSTDFYERVLPLLGLRRSANVPEGPIWAGPGLELGLVAARSRSAHDRFAPGLHHLAFSAPSRAAVDLLHQRLEALGVAILDAPADYPRYAPGYYAVFFADPDGMKLEYVFTPRWPT
jgi:glutathione S-transferase/catechol 2,3-dioxygenase-like lactoylglutathione lyase family enzyme